MITFKRIQKQGNSHLRFGTRLGHYLKVIQWRTCVCSRWYIHTTRWQRRFDSSSLFFCFIYIIQKSFEYNQRHTRIVEVLGLFMWSKNPPSATEDAQRLSKQMWFTKNFKYGSNSKSQSNRTRVAFQIASVNRAYALQREIWGVGLIPTMALIGHSDLILYLV